MDWIYVAADLVLISILVLGFYRSRHGRKDLVIALMGSNVGVMVVASALQDISAAASVGVGLGLFGVLSIIRLRSTELEQHDVAYYFSALAIGLVAGLGVGVWWLACALMSLPIITLAFVDSPRFLPNTRRQRITLGYAATNEQQLEELLSKLLNARIVHTRIIQTDVARGRTTVNVVYRVHNHEATKELTQVGTLDSIAEPSVLAGPHIENHAVQAQEEGLWRTLRHPPISPQAS